MSNDSYLEVDKLSMCDIARIFSKIRVIRETDCWEWTGERNSSGYGRVKFGGRRESVHRLIYAWLVERLPRRASEPTCELDHVVCQNKSCCNPSHVKLVDHRENVLRGTGPTADNARKTHCIRGHLLPASPNDPRRSKRYCKECCSIAGKLRYRQRVLASTRENTQ